MPDRDSKSPSHRQNAGAGTVENNGYPFNVINYYIICKYGNNNCVTY